MNATWRKSWKNPSVLAWVLALVMITWAGSRLLPRKSALAGLDEFGSLPVLFNGRVLPFDTLARVSLSMMNHHGSPDPAGQSHRAGSPVGWLLETLAMPEHADANKVFEIDNPEIIDLFRSGVSRGPFYSFNDLRSQFSLIDEQARLAEQIPAETRNAFQRAIIKLRAALWRFVQLKNSLQPEGSADFGQEIALFSAAIKPGLQAIRDRDAQRSFDAQAFEKIIVLTQRYQKLSEVKLIYPVLRLDSKNENDRWQAMPEALLGAIASGEIPYPVQAFGTMISTFRSGDQAAFAEAVHRYKDYVRGEAGGAAGKTALEYRFNQAQPFVVAITLYVFCFVLVVLSWLTSPRTLIKGAAILLVFAFLLHTGGLLVRMYLQGRPPVTNLYSSAIFVGWGAVLLCLLLEFIYKNSLGTLSACAVGFVTLLIAQNLQLDGDTMEMLRAVLDTNVWLATHVVCEALGYSSTFVAGLLGVVYILRGVLTRSLAPETGKSISRMIYGVACFATLFSLVGTVLGGIWGDQSWGRFWGWDPKENGALLVVLWNAIILHARWGGLVRERGIAMMAVFGNVVTSLSWFGTNMLGVGLHSYGFTEQAFGTLALFIGSQLAVIAVGAIPLRRWRSSSVKRVPLPASNKPVPV